MPATPFRRKRRHEDIDGAGDVAPKLSPPTSHRVGTSSFSRDKDTILEMCRAESEDVFSELKVVHMLQRTCIHSHNRFSYYFRNPPTCRNAFPHSPRMSSTHYGPTSTNALLKALLRYLRRVVGCLPSVMCCRPWHPPPWPPRS